MVENDSSPTSIKLESSLSGSRVNNLYTGATSRDILAATTTFFAEVVTEVDIQGMNVNQGQLLSNGSMMEVW